MSSTRSILRYCALLVAVGLSAPVATAQPGALDPSFGDGGVVLIDSASVESVVIDSDGRIVTWGWKRNEGSRSNPILRRLRADGTADLTFGADGTVPFPASGFNTFHEIPALVVLPSGVIVAAESVFQDTLEGLGRWHFVNPDGTVEATVPWGQPVWAIVARPDGRRLVFEGGNWWSGCSPCQVRQFQSDGIPDPAFGDSGVVDLNIGGHIVRAALLGDGRLVVFTERGDEFYSARLLEDGSLDPSYGEGGIVVLPLDGFTAGAVDEDGSVLLGANRYSDFTHPTLVRLTPEGAVDATFGDGGVATLESLGEGSVSNVASLPGGGAIVTPDLADRPSALASRLLADGTLDPSFGEDGVAYIDLDSAARSESSLVIDAEGRIVVAGGGRGGMGFIVRLINDEAVASEPSGQPARLALLAPAPNPASAETTLAYTLAEPAPARLTVYDVLGREVAVLAEGTQAAGQHDVTLDASRLVPGLYVARLTAGGEAITRRLTVVR